VGDDLDAELSQIGELNGAIETTLTAIRSGTTRVEEQGEVVSAQGEALRVMQGCLAGVQQALTAARFDNFAGAVEALAFVEDLCARALDRSPAASGYPMIDANFPDPFVVAADGEYFAYATNGNAGPVQMARGPSLDRMRLLGPAIQQLPPWGSENRTWAPAVWKIGGRWVMYYSLNYRVTGHTCISRAWAPSPAGPFTDDTTAGPIVCRERGAIDPSPFRDEHGDPWLAWKAEQGWAPGAAATIFSQRLTDDGLNVVGEAVPMIDANQPWEEGVVEAPSMVVSGGRYLLFYSGAGWYTSRYGVGYAECEGPAGPCTKPRDRPIFSADGGLVGAAGQEAFVDLSGRLRMVFHAWVGAEIGNPFPRRAYIADLSLGPVPAMSRIRIGA
jgi:hypothetical protein